MKKKNSSPLSKLLQLRRKKFFQVQKKLEMIEKQHQNDLKTLRKEVKKLQEQITEVHGSD